MATISKAVSQSLSLSRSLACSLSYYQCSVVGLFVSLASYFLAESFIEHLVITDFCSKCRTVFGIETISYFVLLLSKSFIYFVVLAIPEFIWPA